MNRRAPSLLAVLIAIAVSLPSAQDQNLDQVRRKAVAGDAKAQYDMAAAYYSGKGVAKDPVQGLDWLKKSARQGYVGAEFALALMYQKGEASVSKNPHEAASWFRKAAVQKNEAAKTHLEEMLSQGLISKQEATWNVPVKAPEKSPAKTSSAFSLAEVDKGLTGGISNKRMGDLVQKYGVDFSLNAAAKKRLSDDGADENLLAAISNSRR